MLDAKGAFTKDADVVMLGTCGMLTLAGTWYGVVKKNVFLTAMMGVIEVVAFSISDRFKLDVEGVLTKTANVVILGVGVLWRWNDDDRTLTEDVNIAIDIAVLNVYLTWFGTLVTFLNITGVVNFIAVVPGGGDVAIVVTMLVLEGNRDDVIKANALSTAVISVEVVVFSIPGREVNFWRIFAVVVKSSVKLQSLLTTIFVSRTI